MLTHVLSLVTVLQVVGGPAGREAIGHQKRVFAAAAAAADSPPARLSSSAATWLPNSARSRLPRLPLASAPVAAVRHRPGVGVGGQRRYSGRKRSSSCQQSTRGAPGQSERRGVGRGGWDRYGSPNTPLASPTAALTSTVKRLIQP